jgi:hypothetical protein
LGWVLVLDAIGEELSDEDKARCEAWRSALAAKNAAAVTREPSLSLEERRAAV